MRRACKVPALPSGFYADDLWQLIGPADPMSSAVIQLYLDSVGTAAEWAEVGLPVRFDAAGAPLPRRHGSLSCEYVLRTPADAARLVSCLTVAKALAAPVAPRAPIATRPRAGGRRAPAGGGTG